MLCLHNLCIDAGDEGEFPNEEPIDDEVEEHGPVNQVEGDLRNQGKLKRDFIASYSFDRNWIYDLLYFQGE